MLAVYTRISTDEQNIDTQRAVISDWLQVKGLKATWFEDEGYSGDTVRRPAFAAMRREKELEALIVYRLDRLSRKTSVGVSLLHNWLSKGVRIISVMEGIDLDPTDPDMAGVVVDIIVPLLFGLAANEQRVRRQRQRSGIDRVLADPDLREEKYKGRMEGTFKREPAEAKRLCARGWTHNEIAKQLGVSRRSVLRYCNEY